MAAGSAVLGVWAEAFWGREELNCEPSTLGRNLEPRRAPPSGPTHSPLQPFPPLPGVDLGWKQWVNPVWITGISKNSAAPQDCRSTQAWRQRLLLV